MENEIIKSQFEKRLGSTLMRLSWLMAFLAYIPALIMAFITVMALALVLKILVMLAIVVCTLFLVLLNEGFREKFRTSIDSQEIEAVQQFAERAYGVFSVAMPLMIALTAAFIVASVVLAFVQKEKKGRASRVVSAILCALVMTVAAVTFYGMGA